MARYIFLLLKVMYPVKYCIHFVLSGVLLYCLAGYHQRGNTSIELTDALNRFHQYCAIFVELGINLGGISLLLQHSLVHYHTAIQGFGALNGLCSSITESKHIHAVKSPYRCSNYYKALCQMLLMNNCCNL